MNCVMKSQNLPLIKHVEEQTVQDGRNMTLENAQLAAVKGKDKDKLNA